MSDSGNPLVGLLVILVIVSTYFIPSFIASMRKTDVSLGVFLTNLLLGWTFVGWVGALIWAVSAKSKRQKLADAMTNARLAASFNTQERETLEGEVK